MRSLNVNFRLLSIQFPSATLPGAGLEPAQPKPQDFKSCVSTDSTIRAKDEASPGFEPGIRLLQSLALATWPRRQEGSSLEIRGPGSICFYRSARASAAECTGRSHTKFLQTYTVVFPPSAFMQFSARDLI